jgi:hypothetical protein
MRTFLSILILGALSCSVAKAQQEPVRFLVETLSASLPDAVLVALAADGTLQLKDDRAARTIPRFISLRQVGAELPPLPTRNFLLLTNGDRIPLDPDASAVLEGNRLQVWPAKESFGGKELSFYAPNIVLLFWSLPEAVDDADLYFAKISKETRERDVVHLQNGDRVEGAVAALSGKEGCTITTDRGKLRLPWSKIAGIAWNTDRQVRLGGKKTHWRAALDGGGRITLLDLRFDEKSRRWSAAAQFGATLDLPEGAILALDARQGAVVDLTNLTPTRYVHKPYLGVIWPLRWDVSANGSPLRLAGNTYERGLGTHAACRVEYKLDGKYQRFLSTVGIDEGSRRGRAKVAIELDGKRVELNEGKELTCETAPLSLALDVRNVKTMTLLVERGNFGDVQAHVNWANARLVKSD